MTGMHLTYAFHLQGSPTNDEVETTFKLPVAATLVHVSAVGSNANNSTLDVGTASDSDGVLSAFGIGNSAVPTVADLGDFNGALVTNDFYHYAKNETVTFYVENGGATAVDDPTIVLTFLEG